MKGNEAFARVKIDALLQDQGWNLTDGKSVRFELPLPDGTKADYVIFSRTGHPLAVLEAQRSSLNPVAGRDQALAYAAQLDVPFIFLSNDEQVQFMDRDVDAHARNVATNFAQDDLTRFTTDVPFASPSAAAAVILNRNSNGRVEWRVEGAGMTYAD